MSGVRRFRRRLKVRSMRTLSLHQHAWYLDFLWLPRFDARLKFSHCLAYRNTHMEGCRHWLLLFLHLLSLLHSTLKLVTFVFHCFILLLVRHEPNGTTSSIATIHVTRIWASNSFPSGSTSFSLSTWTQKPNPQCKRMSEHLPKNVDPTVLQTLLLFDRIHPLFVARSCPLWWFSHPTVQFRHLQCHERDRDSASSSQ